VAVRLALWAWTGLCGPVLAAQAPEQEDSPVVSAEAPAPERGPPPVAGEYEVLEEPGFVVHYANCDGSLPTADRLTLPRRLSRRYTDMSAMVRAELADGKPLAITLLEGDEPLFEAIRWHVERARFAPGLPACVMLHYQVVDTVLKASEIIEFRVWVDVEVRPDGRIVRASLVDELASEEVARAILRHVESWQLAPTVRDGHDVTLETSLRVDVRMEPSGWTSYTIATQLARRGARPVKVVDIAFPRRLASVARRGSVLLEFMVSEKGKPIDPRIVKSEPPGVFDQVALATIKRWRYKPDTVNGQVEITGPVRQVLQFDVSRRTQDHPSVPRNMQLRGPPSGSPVSGRPPTEDR
jgi:TonB family protein